MRPPPPPDPLPLRPPSGGSVFTEPPPALPPPLDLFRLKVVPGPDPNPLAASSSMLETDLSSLLSSLRARLVLEDASPISCNGRHSCGGGGIRSGVGSEDKQEQRLKNKNCERQQLAWRFRLALYLGLSAFFSVLGVSIVGGVNVMGMQRPRTNMQVLEILVYMSSLL